MIALWLIFPRGQATISHFESPQTATVERHREATIARMQQLVIFIHDGFNPMRGFPETLADVPTLKDLSRQFGTGTKNPLLYDSWGGLFSYQVSSDRRSFSLISYGSDKTLGGSGDGRDLELRHAPFPPKRQP